MSKLDPNMYARVRHIQVITVDLPSNKGGTPFLDLSNLNPGEDPSKCFCSQLQMPHMFVDVLSLLSKKYAKIAPFSSTLWDSKSHKPKT